jgi:hypothetical protein
MNRLNPIYILALIVTISIVSFLALNGKIEQYNKTYSSFQELKKEAKYYKQYQTKWFDRNRTLQKLDYLLRTLPNTKATVSKRILSSGIRVKVDSIDPRILNSFLNKLLNEEFMFRTLDIKKDSISFEIGFN